MSKKRTAERELNHDNWDDEETPDEQGEFKKASKDTLSQRKVLIGKRRNLTNPTNTSEGLFSSFKGFSNTTAQKPTPGTFDFFKKLTPQANNSTSTSPTSLTSSSPSQNSTTTGLTSSLSGSNAGSTLSNTIEVKTSLSGSNAAPPPDLISVKPANNPYAKLFGNTPSWSQPPSVQSTPTTTTISATQKDEPVKSKRIKCDTNDSDGPSNKKLKESTAGDPASEALQIFEEKVKVLNIKFVNFLSEKVKANPKVILFPPMDDYRKYIEKFVKERIEYETSKLFAKDGFNFEYIPPLGESGKVTLQNNVSGEVKTFQIGATKESKPAETSSSSTPKFTGFSSTTNQFNKPSTEASSKDSFSYGLSSATASGDTNGTTKPGLFSFGAVPTAPTSGDTFSFKSPDAAEKVGEAGKSETLAAKPNFSFGLAKSEPKEESKPLGGATVGFKWGSASTTTPDSKATTSAVTFGMTSKPMTTSGSGSSFFNKPAGESSNPLLGGSTGTNPLLSRSSGTNPLLGGSTGKNPLLGGSAGANPLLGGSAGANPLLGGSSASPKPFSFDFASSPAPTPASAEDDDEPLPKEEVKEVEEENSIFNIKCKIFVMKPDKSYGERGVGKLFVKTVEEKVKGQVIVRAATDTGKIIFNIVVNNNVPIKQDKNNLILVTIPHPTMEKNPTPCTCLIRVKTPEDAEKLLKVLETFKG
uniref:Nuclear pore complex protein Nup50 n=1 Tax=Cacopsylla melanoneura TaxID=428564 RepID=A0A8D8S935_9HEMI